MVSPHYSCTFGRSEPAFSHSQAPYKSPVVSIPDGLAVQEIKVSVGTPRQCFRLDVGVVYGVEDILTVGTIYTRMCVYIPSLACMYFLCTGNY